MLANESSAVNAAGKGAAARAGLQRDDPGLTADSGRADARAWLQTHFDAIGVEATLDIDEALKRNPPAGKIR